MNNLSLLGSFKNQSDKMLFKLDNNLTWEKTRMSGLKNEFQNWKVDLNFEPETWKPSFPKTKHLLLFEKIFSFII